MALPNKVQNLAITYIESADHFNRIYIKTDLVNSSCSYSGSFYRIKNSVAIIKSTSGTSTSWNYWLGNYTVDTKFYDSSTAQVTDTPIMENINNGVPPTSAGFFITVPVFNKGDDWDISVITNWTELPINNEANNSVYLPFLNKTLYSFVSFIGHFFPTSREAYDFLRESPSWSTIKSFKTFPKLPSIQNPTSVYPLNISVDATISNTFSFVFNGSSLGAYVYYINDANSGQSVYSETSEVLEEPKYNGDTIEFDITLSSGGITNGRQYVWHLDLYEYHSGYTEIDDYKENDLPFTTVPFYFETLSTPTFSATGTPNDIFSGDTLTSKELIVNGTYSQSQNIPLKYYKVILRDSSSSGRIIDDSGKIFSSYINYKYSGFLNEKTYFIEIVAENQKQQIATITQQFEVAYDSSYSGSFYGSSSVDNCQQMISIAWSKEAASQPQYDTNEISYVNTSSPYNDEEMSNKSVNIQNTYLTYDNLAGSDFKIPQDDFSICFRTKINSSTIDVFGMQTTAYTEYLCEIDQARKQMIVSPSFGESFSINLFSEEVFGVDQSSQPDYKKKYMWYVDGVHNWTVSNSNYFHVDNGIHSSYQFFNFCLSVQSESPQSDNKKLYCSYNFIGDSIPTTYTDITPIPFVYDTETSETSYIQFGKNQTLDAFAYGIGNHSGICEMGVEQSYSWNNPDYSTSSLLCNYADTVVSSISETLTGEIEGYRIFRQRKGYDYETEVGDFSISDLENAEASPDHYIIYDYLTRSNESYTYSIYPYSTVYDEQAQQDKQIFQTKYKVLNDINGTEINTTDWEGYTLIPIIQNSYNSYSVPSTFNREYPVWTFTIDREESEITQNQDKEVFTTFAKTPKVSVGMLDYETGQLSVKLGNIGVNYEYYEPYSLVQKWYEFIGSNRICLLKNPKGDMKIVSIDANSNRAYMNETANYYNNVNGITAYPTTINFSYTEIAKIDDININVVLLTTEENS